MIKLRHSFVTEAVKNGTKIHGLEQMLGHASIATIEIYLHAERLSSKLWRRWWSNPKLLLW